MNEIRITKEGRENMKGKICIIGIIMMCICACGCRLKNDSNGEPPQFGKLLDKSEIEEYAQKKYGDCELVSYEETEDSHKCVFLDKEDGFQYYVKSYMQRVGGLSDDVLWSSADIMSEFGPSYYENYLYGELSEYRDEHEGELLAEGLSIRFRDWADWNDIYHHKRMTLAYIDDVSNDNIDMAKEWAYGYMNAFSEIEDRNTITTTVIILMSEKDENGHREKLETLEFPVK